MMKAIITLALLGSGLLYGASSHADTPHTNGAIGEVKIHTAKYEDTLVHLARKNNLGFVEIRAANPTLDPWIPGENARVILPTKHVLPDTDQTGIAINLPEMRLYYFKDKGSPPVSFPIGVGREGFVTPLGQTTIMRKAAKPIWYPTERMREEDPDLPATVPPGPENPLGTHALYLGFPQILIHGTNKPYGIGRRVSSGCIRMYPEHIEKLFDLVPVGTAVTVVDQPIKAAWIGDTFYVEAHPRMADAVTMEEKGYLPNSPASDEDVAYVLEMAASKTGKAPNNMNWTLLRQILDKRSGVPVAIAGGKINTKYNVHLLEAAKLAPASGTDQNLTNPSVSRDVFRPQNLAN